VFSGDNKALADYRADKYSPKDDKFVEDVMFDVNKDRQKSLDEVSKLLDDPD
jgi:hypothetical protein